MIADTQDRNFRWFVENYDELYKQYGVSYLAIKDRAVIGVYNSYVEALKETCKTEELGTFNIQFCNGDDSGYTSYIVSMNFM